MNEHEALLVTAVRAVEIADRPRTLWSDADRAWASRAAAEVIGEGARPDVFIARRAVLAFDRIAKAHAPLRRALRSVQWRGWIGPLIAGVALAAGVAFDRIGAGRTVNLLAPPVLALLVWHLAVYVWLAVAPIAAAGRPIESAAGPLRRMIVRIAGRLRRTPAAGPENPLSMAVATFASDWAAYASPLYYARAARVLHVAAAMFAIGVVAGLYLRGLAFEYRATWESTFLDASTVQRILAVALWPGSLVTGISVPTIAELEAIRSSAAPASENAAGWLHLLAATVAIVVIVPRLLLAFFTYALERHRASRLRLPLSEAYFQRLLRGYHGGPVRVSVVPYSYRVPQSSLDGLQAIIARVFGGSAGVACSAPVAYGDEDALPASLRADTSGPLIALFNLAATPEREAHARFVRALGEDSGTQAVLVLIDEAPLRARAGDDVRRLEERRASWRELFAEVGIEPVFADLSMPDIAAIETALEARLEAPRAS